MGPYQVALLREFSLSQACGLRTVGSSAASANSAAATRPLGNLVAEAMLARSDVFAEFSLTNSGGIRTNLNAGPITVEQLFNVFPFDNTIATIALAGTEVKEMLDFVARRSASRGCSTQVQVSGIAFTIDCRFTTCDTACRRLRWRRAAPAPPTTTVPSPWGAIMDDAGCVLTECNPMDYGPVRGDDPAVRHRRRVRAELHRDLHGRAAGGRWPAAAQRTWSTPWRATTTSPGAASGFDVLARNTTQLDTGISLRDAVQDYIIGLGLCDRSTRL